MSKRSRNKLWIIPLFFVSFLVLNNSLFVHLHFMPDSNSESRHPVHRHSEAEFIIVQDMYSLFTSAVTYCQPAVSIYHSVIFLKQNDVLQRIVIAEESSLSGRAPPPLFSI